MTRKLHNTLMAALASTSLLVVSLIVSAPVAPHLAHVNATDVLASLDTEVEATTDVIGQRDATPQPMKHAVRYRQQTLAMPFFSFAPRS